MQLQDIQLELTPGFDLSFQYLNSLTFSIGAPNHGKPMRTVKIDLPLLPRPYPMLSDPSIAHYYRACPALAKLLGRHRQFLSDILYSQTKSAPPEVVEALNRIYSGTLATRFLNLYNFPLFPEEK